MDFVAYHSVRSSEKMFAYLSQKKNSLTIILSKLFSSNWLKKRIIILKDAQFSETDFLVVREFFFPFLLVFEYSGVTIKKLRYPLLNSIIYG